MIRRIPKKCYRTCVIIATSITVISIVTLDSNSYSGSGRNKAGKPGANEYASASWDEEDVSETQADVQAANLAVETGTLATDSSLLQEEDQSQQNTEEDQEEEQPDQNSEHDITEEETGENTDETIEEPQEDEQETNDETEEDTEDMPEEAPEAVSTQVVALSDSDYDVLLRIVEAEAQGEGMTGKLLVANVIINRLNSGSFPDSVHDVVFDTSGGSAQFSPTVDGRIYSVSISDETVEAVSRALEGEDPSMGALYFAARAHADPQNMNWFDENLTWLFAHGGHEFFR